MKVVTGAVIGTLLLGALFLSVHLREDATLENSLVDMSILPPVLSRAVLYASGTELTGELRTQTLAQEQNPSLLRGRVEIPRGVTVTVTPGTIIAAEEGASLTVTGTLRATRASFLANHQHPRRRFWHGIVARDGGVVELSDVQISDATAGVTCGERGRVTARRGTFLENTAHVVSLAGSTQCRLDAVYLRGGRVGVQAVGGSPVLTNLSLRQVADGLRVFHGATPSIENLTLRNATRAVVYAATPPLRIRGLVLPTGSDPATVIVDGTDTPTHRWESQDFPTGRVVVLP